MTNVVPIKGRGKAKRGNSKRITQTTVQAEKAPATGNTIVYDKEVKGFGLRVTAAGVKAFILNYRVHGKERRYTIGRWPELTATAARERAIQLRQQVRDGVDPLQERRGAVNSGKTDVSGLAAAYLGWVDNNLRESTARDYRRYIEKHILPRYGHIPAEDLRRQDFEVLRVEGKGKPYRTNRMLAAGSAMYSWAIENRWDIPFNPVAGVKPWPEKKRERYLDAGEIERLLKVLGRHNVPGSDALRLILFTGCRKSEALKAEWQEFELDRDNPVWTKPSHHTKQKRTEHVPLNELAVQLLEQLRRKAKRNSRYVFPRRGDPSKPTQDVKGLWQTVCREARIKNARIHDLRHTFASVLISDGESLPITGKLLGHTQASTTQRYAHIFDEAQRKATHRFAAIVKGSK